jgi:hypothetical protein
MNLISVEIFLTEGPPTMRILTIEFRKWKFRKATSVRRLMGTLWWTRGRVPWRQGWCGTEKFWWTALVMD